MGTNTPNYNLYKPSEGEDGWADEVNDNFDTIDSNLDTDEEAVEDVVGGLIAGGDKITATYDDPNNTLTIDTSALDTEEVEDAVGSLITAGNATTVNYDDGADTLTIGVDESGIQLADLGSKAHSELTNINPDDHHSRYTDEEAQDAINALLSGGSNISLTYDDVGDTLTIDTSALNEEEVEDAVTALTTGGNAITVNYDDPNDTLTIAVDESAISHNNLSGIGSDDHHSRYTDGEAISAINSDVDHGSTASHNYFSGSHPDLSNITSDDHHTRYSDSEAISAINNDNDHGSTASHNYFSGDHGDLTNVQSDQHHTRYSDEEAQDAINALLSEGSNVTLTYDDGANELTIAATDSRTDVSNTGSLVESDVTDINFDSNLAVNSDGDGSVTVDASGGSSSIQSYTDFSALPDPSNVTEPQIAYLESEDDYVGVFQA